MKTNSILILFTTILFSISCKKNSDVSGSNSIDSTQTHVEKVMTFESTIKHLNKKEKTGYVQMDYPEFTSAPNNVLKDTLNEAVKELLGIKTTTFEKFAKEFLKDNEDNLAMENYIIDTVFYSNYENAVTLCSFNELYAGGAHGMHGQSFISFDIKNVKRINLNSILNPNSKDFKNTCIDAFIKDNGIEGKGLSAIVAAGFDGLEKGFKLPESESFAISKDGITFNYASYEIGAYAMGMPSFTLTWDQLKPFLKKDNPVLIK